MRWCEIGRRCKEHVMMCSILQVKDREPTKDSLYLVIDARRNMWAKNDAGEARLRPRAVVPIALTVWCDLQVYFRNAINVAVHVLKTKIISSEDDLVGVILVGTVSQGLRVAPSTAWRSD